MTIRTHTNPASVAIDVDGLAVIGRTVRDLRGLRFGENDGGNTGGDTGGTGSTGTPGGTGDATGTGGNAGTGGNTTPDLTGGGDAEAPFGRDKDGKPFTPEQTRAYISSLRGEAQASRTEKEAAVAAAAEATARQNAILAALGLTPDGKDATKNDPEKLANQVTETTRKLAEQAQDNVVLRNAFALGADADKLLDKVSFLNKLRSKESTDAEGIKALISEAIANDASLKLNIPAASSGGGSHTGTTSNTGRKNMHDAVKSKLTTR